MSDVDLNRTHWDELASVHGTGDALYDVDRLLGGWDSRTAPERTAIAEALRSEELGGKRIMHLQSHIGFDAVSMARLGAKVTAVDFSDNALAKARDIAGRAGVELETVAADATRLPAELDERFDCVYANLGAICWIEDLAAWMRAAYGALVPGGALALVDLHPFGLMVETVEPMTLGFPYEFARFQEDQHGTYADPDAELAQTTTVNFAHSLAEIYTAARGAGFDVEHLREHLELEFDCWGDGQVKQEEDGLFRLRQDGYAIPVLFTLVGRK
jgi:SAM-dependent methyltransferase